MAIIAMPRNALCMPTAICNRCSNAPKLILKPVERLPYLMTTVVQMSRPFNQAVANHGFSSIGSAAQRETMAVELRPWREDGLRQIVVLLCILPLMQIAM